MLEWSRKKKVESKERIGHIEIQQDKFDELARLIVRKTSRAAIDADDLKAEKDHVELRHDHVLEHILLDSTTDQPKHASPAHLLAVAEEWLKRRSEKAAK